MIDAPRLLKELQGLLRHMEDDLRERVGSVPELDAKLRAEHQASMEGGRTGQAYEQWREGALTQAAVAWILGCVFVRFLEDNSLVETPRLSGPGERRQRALDQHELYFKDPNRRTYSDRDYLLYVFEETQKLPAAREVFDEKHNPLWSIGLSGDGATQLLEFWQRIDPDTGSVGFDFTDPEWNTRVLGDLYQDLSESARKKYALLQTPEFVEEFILDRTLTPAIDEFGFQEVRLIDPTCGSGHFLLGAFHRLFDLWVQEEPGTNPRELAQRALSQVYGVDLNPFAVAIARFRLLVAALKVCDVGRLADAPRFELNLAVGDSLLHGRRFRKVEPGTQQTLDPQEDPLRHVFETEDAHALRRILGQQYHAVVGNPPYITVKDKVLNRAYRDLYGACHRKFALVVPFMERFFNLSLIPSASTAAGCVGLIVANSFMKREFGKKLIEQVLSHLDLTHLVDTSGAYIPGHGTPTVIVFGRHRPPVGGTIRAVRGIKGEPATPDDPAEGRVWNAILEQIDWVGSESEWVSVSDVERGEYAHHPWSLGGGGASELKGAIEATASGVLGERIESIGFGAILGEDNAFCRRPSGHEILSLPPDRRRRLVEGELVRDWGLESRVDVIFPYSRQIRLADDPKVARLLWPLRTLLWARRDFSRSTYREAGRAYFEYHQNPSDKYRTPLSIAFAEVATHNHFVLDRGGKVFKQTAPIIKLPPGATEEEHLELLGLLNSSTACFWMQQVFHNKGGPGGASSKDEKWHDFYQHDGTKMRQLPVPKATPRFLALARLLDTLKDEYISHEPSSILTFGELDLKRLDEGAEKQRVIRRRQIAAQEELDWEIIATIGLTPGSANLHYTAGELPEVDLGARAFELVMSGKVSSGELRTRWFERLGIKMYESPPTDWPTEYRQVVKTRMKLIEADRRISLIESMNSKRRWEEARWEDRLHSALELLLAAKLEKQYLAGSKKLTTVAQLADLAARDTDFMVAGERYRQHQEFEVVELVDDIVSQNAVPAVSMLRFRPPGLRKHAVWKKTWDLQRSWTFRKSASLACPTASGPRIHRS
jgi:hypothetical protein